MIITIIAYKSNGNNQFRGHVSERWDSELEQHITDDVQDAIEWLGNMKSQSLSLKFGHFEFTVLLNGIDNNDWHEWDTEEERAERDEIHTRIVEESDQFAAKAEEEKKAYKVRKEAEVHVAADKARKTIELNALKSSLSSETIEAKRARMLELEAELTS